MRFLRGYFWTAPGLVVRKLLPELQAHGKERMIWLPWFAVVVYAIVDRVVAVTAQEPDPGVVILKIESARAALADRLLHVPTAFATWASGRVATNVIAGSMAVAIVVGVVLFVLALLFIGPFTTVTPRIKKRAEAESHGTAHWGTFDRALGAGRPRIPAAFLLDEFPQLGRMTAVEDAISLVAGYGALLWLFVQDLSQLKVVYPKWETFLANSTLQAFGTQDQFTARYLSEALGAETIMVATENQSRSASEMIGRPGSKSHGTAVAHHGRALLLPDEIRRTSDREVIVLHQGQPPFLLQRLDYRTDREWAGKADSNPMYARAGRTAGASCPRRSA